MASMTSPSAQGQEAADEPSYIDYEAFLSPDFTPASFANALVVATNNPDDSPLDLSTPLSRVLFDAQELDSHIDRLTTRFALPLLEYTQTQTEASTHIITELDAQMASLNESYKQLDKDVVDRHAEADQVRLVAIRLWETLRLGRALGRCLQLGRQLQVQHAELVATSARHDYSPLVRCCYTILSLRELLDGTAPDDEGYGLARVDAARSLQQGVAGPLERSTRETAERVVADFGVAPNMTFAQGQEARARLDAAMTALYLLSPTPDAKPERWTPRLLLQALETYMRAALQTSTTALARSLGQLPSLDRALADVTAKCQNVVGLQLVLESTKPPAHPLLPPHKEKQTNMLQPLLAHLEIGSLASYFWRSMASGLASRVQEIVSRGGVVARTLRSNKGQVGDAIRQAVLKGCQTPGALVDGAVKRARGKAEANWDREVAVMVGSVVNNLR